MEVVQNLKESQTKPQSLREKLELLTQIKTPGDKRANTAKTASIWNSSDDDFSEQPQRKPDTDKEKKNNVSTSGSEKDNRSSEEEPLTKEQKQASAEASVGMIDMISKLIGLPIIHFSFKGSFTEGEMDKIYPLIDLDKETLQGDSLTMRNKWDRLVAKQNRQQELIKTPEKDKQQMIEAIKLYEEFTGKRMSPGLFVAAAIVQSVGNRIIDVIME